MKLLVKHRFFNVLLAPVSLTCIKNMIHVIMLACVCLNWAKECVLRFIGNSDFNELYAQEVC